MYVIVYYEMNHQQSTCIFPGESLPHLCTLCTVQHKIFEGYKFQGFCCFPSKHENEWMASHMAINYACDPQNLFLLKSKFNKFAKFIAHEIFTLYGMSLIIIINILVTQ